MTHTNEAPRCIQCEKTSDDAPLMQVQYKKKTIWICTEHLPLMIHSPAKLADKLPGMENVQGHDH